MDLRLFPELIFVRLSNNNLTGLQLIGLPNLTYLICSGNDIEDLTIDSPGIEAIHADENKLKCISIADISQLVVPEDYETNEEDCLDIRYNRFETIPQNLVDKFGKAWAEQMLGQQGDAPEEPDEEMDDVEQPQPDVDMTEIPAAAQPTLLIQHKRQSEDELSEKSEHKSDNEEDFDDLEDDNDRVFKWRR